MLYYKDVIFPKSRTEIRMLDDQGHLSEAAWTASAGETGYALIAKVIVDEAWRLDEGLRRHLKDMLDVA